MWKPCASLCSRPKEVPSFPLASWNARLPKSASKTQNKRQNELNPEHSKIQKYHKLTCAQDRHDSTIIFEYSSESLPRLANQSPSHGQSGACSTGFGFSSSAQIAGSISAAQSISCIDLQSSLNSWNAKPQTVFGTPRVQHLKYGKKSACVEILIIHKDFESCVEQVCTGKQ